MMTTTSTMATRLNRLIILFLLLYIVATTVVQVQSQVHVTTSTIWPRARGIYQGSGRGGGSDDNNIIKGVQLNLPARFGGSSRAALAPSRIHTLTHYIIMYKYNIICTRQQYVLLRMYTFFMYSVMSEKEKKI